MTPHCHSAASCSINHCSFNSDTCKNVNSISKFCDACDALDIQASTERHRYPSTPQPCYITSLKREGTLLPYLGCSTTQAGSMSSKTGPMQDTP